MTRWNGTMDRRGCAAARDAREKMRCACAWGGATPRRAASARKPMGTDGMYCVLWQSDDVTRAFVLDIL